MSSTDVTVRVFIKDYLITKIGEIKDTQPYFAFVLMAIGIEFLGKCQNEHDWDDYKLIQPRVNFNNGLNLAPLKKYANLDLYDKLRNGLAHSLLIKQGINVSEGDYHNALNSNTFYSDFEAACNLVLNAKDDGSGKIMTADGIEIKKNLDATFFTIENGVNQDGEFYSLTATTINNLVKPTNNQQ